MTSPSEANLLVHYEDFELAQSVKRELMQLRSRSTMPNSEDVMLVARKAPLTGSSPSAAVDKIRMEAWLAIGKLAAAIDRNTWAGRFQAVATVRTKMPFLHTRNSNIEARNVLGRATTINSDFAAHTPLSPDSSRQRGPAHGPHAGAGKMSSGTNSSLSTARTSE
jgi:hypothetical protein